MELSIVMKIGIHWIAIIGYDYNNGNEKIFVSDSGWSSGPTGWHDIDEFDRLSPYISNYVEVSER